MRLSESEGTMAESNFETQFQKARGLQFKLKIEDALDAYDAILNDNKDLNKENKLSVVKCKLQIYRATKKWDLALKMIDIIINEELLDENNVKYLLELHESRVNLYQIMKMYNHMYAELTFLIKDERYENMYPDEHRYCIKLIDTISHRRREKDPDPVYVKNTFNDFCFIL